MMRKMSCGAATNVISEAHTLAGLLVEIERSKCGGDVDLAIHRVAAIYGVDEGALRSLRYRWRDLHDVKASLLERLREAYEAVYERQRAAAVIEREIDATLAAVPNHSNSRGGAGGAQEEGAVPVAAPSTIPGASIRDTISRAGEASGKQPVISGAELQLEKEH